MDCFVKGGIQILANSGVEVTFQLGATTVYALTEYRGSFARQASQNIDKAVLYKAYWGSRSTLNS